MEFQLLGPVSINGSDGPLPIGPAKRRSLLAMLLLRAGRAVSVDTLTEVLWDEEPPQHARTVIQGHVWRLRGLLAQADAESYGVRLTTLGGAYHLDLPETLLDAHRFEELVALGRRADDPGDRAALLAEALALWQGPALASAYPSPLLRSAAHTLEEARLEAVELLADAYADAGQYERAARLLRPETGAHPLRESLAAGLVRVLHRADRSPEALEVYHATRRVLADELGVEPGADLSAAYTSALGPGTTPRPPAPTGPARSAGTVRGELPKYAPCLLPRVPRAFHGRGAESAALSEACAGSDGPVVVVTGPAGVGKTALTLHWAAAHRTAFPDGTLHADLRGFSDAPDAEPAELLREFLSALGVPPRRVPESAAAVGALFRELTARRRLLVVLDNARTSAQVRPLLPAGPGCVTVVTSRTGLTGLVASDAARVVPVDVLGAEDSVALLARVLGAARTDAEPDAARRVAELCGGLPLALRVAAARLAARPDWSLVTLADRLADAYQRLALLAAEDIGVASALRLTTAHLPADAARHFTALGHHPGLHVDRFSAAALAGSTPLEAAVALDRLVAAHLLTETGPDRYELHDLVRLYARGLDHDPAARDLARLRLYDHCVATALAAVEVAEPGGEPAFVLPDDHRQPVAVRDFTSREEALGWFAAERDDLALIAAAARAAGRPERAWRIAVTQWPFVVWRVRSDWAPTLEAALADTRACADPYAESRVLTLLGWVLTEEGRTEEALARLRAAPGLAARAGDVLGEATALVNLAVALLDGAGDGERLSAARDACTRALRLATAADDAHTRMLALQHLARIHLTAGRHQEAFDAAQEALGLGPEHEAVSRRVLLRTWQGEALLGLGATEAGARRLIEAAREAEETGYDEGAVTALDALLRMAAPTDSPDLRRRHAAARARIRAR
ncbi:BTAD domain-containing putative transcriptional regulator [Streptomyces sp. NPDC052051]|uniref:AfsR/SARP family transcriptional regulator n=1 Tax=Streptomyces sp. NPDC052051 TaxID=3154649 RepID=UPI003434EF6B